MHKMMLLVLAIIMTSGCSQAFRDRVRAAQQAEEMERNRLIAKVTALPRSDLLECELQGQAAPRSPNDPLPTLWSSGHGETVTDLCLRMKIAKADEAKAAEEAKQGKERKTRPARSDTTQTG